jgi:predicted signal transduction protein with EAL and GGDEF domain/DNA-binding NarL/FixJ family response regulator
VTAASPADAARHLLLVQSPDPLRDALQRCLEEADWQVEARAPEAASSVQAPPEVVLLSDIDDPLALLGELRAIPAIARLPIVVLARDAGSGARWAAIAAGADEVLPEDTPMREVLAGLDAHRRRFRVLHPGATAQPADARARADAPGGDAPARGGVLRRGEFLAQLGRALHDDAPWQVLVALRLDQARELGDSLGQAAAFELEQAVSSRLSSALEPGDAQTLWMAFGFGLLVERSGRAAIEALATRLCASVASAPFVLRGQSLAVTASVGVALAPAGQDAGDTDRWFASAHAAQSIAHRLGGNRFDGVLSRDHGDMPPERVLIIREWVKEAVGGDNVLVEFQPVIPLQEGQPGLYSVQAKLRDYRAPLAGVPRRDFLGLAREAGALPMIDRMSLFAAFEAIEAERAQGRDTRVLVPIDLASLAEPQLLWLEAEIRRRRAHADGLLVELDVELALARSDLAVLVGRLESQGVVIAIADESGGLERIARLQRLPAGLLRVPLRTVDAVGGERFRELLGPWLASGREILVDRVEDVTRVRGLWACQASYAQGDALAAAGPRLDYEFSPFGP